MLAKRTAISESVLRASSNFLSASTYAVHLPRLHLWVHWYMCCIVSGVTPQLSQRLVVACTCQCRIIMVGRVLLMNFMMKCSMCTVVVTHDRLNDVKSILSQCYVWFRIWSSQSWSSWHLYSPPDGMSDVLCWGYWVLFFDECLPYFLINIMVQIDWCCFSCSVHFHPICPIYPWWH